MTTIPALNNVTDILDSDLLLVTHSDGSSYKIAGSEINKRNQAVIAPDATPTTLTGAPLKTGNIVRVYWKVDLTAANGSAPLLLSYNGVNYYVKVPKNGTLASFLPFDLGGGVYKYLQAYTTLDLLYDGTQFVAIENQVLISNADYSIYTDGSVTYKKVVTTERYENVDLNDIKKFGIYKCATALYLAHHYPIASYGILLVSQPAGNLAQIFYPDNVPNSYVRYYNSDNDTWSDWKKVLTDYDIRILSAETLVDNEDCQITYRRTTYNLVIFAIYLKRATSIDITLPFSCYVDSEGIKTGLFWSGAAYGEAYISSTEKNKIKASSTDQCSGELVVFM